MPKKPTIPPVDIAKAEARAKAVKSGEVTFAAAGTPDPGDA